MALCERHTSGRCLLAALAGAAAALVAVGCTTDAPTPAPGATTSAVPRTEPADPQTSGGAITEAGELFPDVIDATATLDPDGTWTFSATLSSPYDSPERYADAWRVIGADGTVYGVRELTHDHAGEQPFTRSQSGIAIPETVTSVIVEGRDQQSGWGGQTQTVQLDR